MMNKHTRKNPNPAGSGAPPETGAKVDFDYWAREFDLLYARMQSDEARRAVDALFSASDDELNR